MHWRSHACSKSLGSPAILSLSLLTYHSLIYPSTGVCARRIIFPLLPVAICFPQLDDPLWFHCEDASYHSSMQGSLTAVLVSTAQSSVALPAAPRKTLCSTAVILADFQSAHRASSHGC
ncbi:hypothetical protein BDR03DRAFT_367876 [Suillus americanus]|nr:hypothetical protein BDR03DRAFT_367876 [Suillus americanus]